MRRLALLVLSLAACAPGGDEHDRSAAATAALTEAPAAYYVVLSEAPAAALVPVGGDPGAAETVARVRRHLAHLALARDALRPRLVAEGATIVAELSRVANAFQVTMTPSSARRVAHFPGVARVEPVPIFERSLASALPLVGAPASWGVPFTGQGIRLGIIDSGIDYLHASFGGSGDPADYASNDRAVVEPGTFPTARVVGGWDFAGDSYDASGGSLDPSPDADPLDCGGGHGTHVAGIAAGGGVLANGSPYAGPYSQSFVSSAFRVAPGVAPEAQLYAIKIFGCSGSTQLFTSGLEWAADPDQDGDMSDRLDVVNASLGTSFGLASPLTDAAVASLASLGTLVVAAAGNEGGTFFALSSPARVPAVLSVAASVDSGLVDLEVTAPSEVAGTLAAVEASFSPSLAVAGPVTGELVAADPVLACGPLANDLSGKIAFVERGSCSFLEKFANAEAAGAIAVVLANNDFGEPPFAMQGSGSSAVPGVMISAADGQILAAASGVIVSLTGQPFDGVGAELIAGLSSRGPSTDARLKPEIAAPGVQIGSVAVGSGSQPSDKSGTSMASPFVAGAAALVREAFPTLGPEAIKAALMNSAVPIGDALGATYPMTMQGTGRLDVAAAVSQTVTLADAEEPGAVGVSFGAFVVSEPVEVSRTVRVQNHGAEVASLTFATEQVHALAGVTIEVSPPSLELVAGGEATIALTLTIDPAVLGDPGLDPVTPPVQFDLPRHALGEADGALVVGGTASARLPFYAVVRAAGEQTLGQATSCSETRVVALEGTSHHPRPVVSAFELGVEDAESAFVEPELDLRAVGAASNAATESFEETSLFFAVVVEGAWSTAAVAGLPLVGVEIDVDDDGGADFLVVPEPLGHEPPHADVLTSTTYDVRDCNGFNLDQCDQIERKRFLNGLPADVAPTHPFFNGAIVLPVYAADLGLEENASIVRYRGVSRTITGTAEQTEWASVDALAPAIDATAGGIREGQPFFEGAVAVQGSGTMLVIHHANVAGKHWEIVEVDALGGVPLALSITAPEAVGLDERVVAAVSLDNGGEADLAGVTVEVSAEGAILVLVSASGGSCVGATCVFDSLPGGATATIDVELVATGPVEIAATVTTAAGCSDTQSLEVALAAEVAPPEMPLVPSGGCGCRLAPASRGGWLTPLFALLLSLGLLRRRRSHAAQA